jgi:hypothetical protein
MMNIHCDNCNNLDICKYSSEYKVLAEMVGKIEIPVGSPLLIRLTCEKWKKIETTEKHWLDKHTHC